MREQLSCSGAVSIAVKAHDAFPHCVITDFSISFAISVNGTTSVATYSARSELDYGTLLCWAKNAIGWQKTPCVFHIVSAGKSPGQILLSQPCSIRYRGFNMYRSRCFVR